MSVGCGFLCDVCLVSVVCCLWRVVYCPLLVARLLVLFRCVVCCLLSGGTAHCLSVVGRWLIVGCCSLNSSLTLRTLDRQRLYEHQTRLCISCRLLRAEHCAWFVAGWLLFVVCGVLIGV